MAKTGLLLEGGVTLGNCGTIYPEILSGSHRQTLISTTTAEAGVVVVQPGNMLYHGTIRMHIHIIILVDLWSVRGCCDF